MRIALITLLVALYTPVTAAQLTITPAQPKSQDTVQIHHPGFGLPEWDQRPQVSMSGSQITVQLHAPGTVTGGLARDLVWGIGQFPAGDYTVQLKYDDGLGTQRVLATLPFTVQQRLAIANSTIPVANYTDLWWQPAESGWGLTIHQHPSDVLFMVWFVYGSDGKPTWYVVPSGQWQSSFLYSGSVYKTTGPFFAGTFDPNLVSRTPVGTATIRFLAYDSALFTYTVEGVTGEKNIVRQSF